MAGTDAPTVVLLPIKPEYAQPIMDGTKRVEFRKTVFSQEPTHVVIYASSPVKKVVGYFEVDTVDVDAVDALWAKYAGVGGIVESAFRDYYCGRERGVALGVDRVVALVEPLPLEVLGLKGGPPQGFKYLDSSVLRKLD
jgi:predicted transcriptional regulator